MPRKVLFALMCLALVAPALGAVPLWTHNATEPVQDCTVSSDGKVVIVSSDLVHIFDRKGSLLATTWHAHDVALGPKASLVVAATDDGVHAVLKNGTELWTRPNRSAAVAVSGDGKTVAGITPGGMLTVFSAAGARTGTADTAATGVIKDLAVSQNGSVVVSTDGGGVRAFTRKGARLWSVELATPSALAMNASGDLVAVGDGGSVKFYNFTGEQAARFSTSGRVRSLAMTPSANLTLAGAEDGTVTALGSQGEPLWVVSTGARVNCVAVSGSGAVAAAASTDRRLRLLDGNGTARWDAPLAGEPRSLALSADGTTVVVGCDEGTAYVFDTGVKPSAAPITPKPANATAANTSGTVSASGVPGGAAVTGTSAAGNATVDAGATARANATASQDGSANVASGTAAGNRTSSLSATGSANGTTPTPLQLVIVNGTPTASGASPFLPAAALALLAAWAGLRRRG